jgi:hypothetical protein
MEPWLETVGVILLSLLGIVLGRRFSRLPKPHWVMGYLFPSLFITMLVLARFTSSVAFVPPLVWITAGRARFVILALAATIGLTTPLSRLPRRCEKFTICVLMAVVVAWFSVLPFLVPALIKGHLSNLITRIDSDGVCFQSTDYTCAPAAAVTALRRLGLPAQEGEIAILSHTSPVAGTLPGCLQTALESRYGAYGLKCEYRYFQSVGQLRDAGLTLAVLKDTFLTDHCVTVLDVSDQTVVIADPVLGRQSMSHEQFEGLWRFTGIVIKRGGGQNI